MNFLKKFFQFWVDFIIGDAWEVALGIAVALVVIAYATRNYEGVEYLLSFALLATILLATWIALMRVTAPKRSGR